MYCGIGQMKKCICAGGAGTVTWEGDINIRMAKGKKEPRAVGRVDWN